MAEGTIEVLRQDAVVSDRVVGGAGPCPALCRQPREGVALEHTLFGNTLELRALAVEMGRDTTPESVYGMAFSETLPEGGTPANQIDTLYNETMISWAYDPSTERWLRSEDGTAHMDALTLTQVNAANIVIFEEEHTIQPEVTPGYWGPGDFAFSVNFIGSGRVYLFRDGQYFEGEWRRETQDGVLTYFDLEGNTLPFKPGNTFFTLVPRWVDGYQLIFHLDDAPLVRVVGDGGQNMRTGPADAYRSLDVAYPGDTFSAVGRNRSADWLQVMRDGDGVYWMALQTLDVNGTDIMALPVSRPTNER